MSLPDRILLAGGSVADGSGGEPFIADVLMELQRIAAVGAISCHDALRVDCAGMVVAPGFIDAHSHSDLQVLEGRREKLQQGVTTEVVGNCGFSAYPTGSHPAELREFANGIFCGDAAWGWASARDYLDEVEARAGALSLVGHGSLRIAQSGLRQGALPPRDVDAMAAMLDDALAAGAAGFSTGLMYAPGSSAPFEELEALCRVVARRGKVYATHMRGYFGDVLDAIDEQLELARRTGCKLQISHLQVVGRGNWPLQPRALEKIEAAHAQGIDVAFDCYPYTAGSTVLTQILPQWALDGGADALVARLREAGERARIARETQSALAWDWRDIVISAVASGTGSAVVGRTMADIAADTGRAPVEAALDLLAAERGAVNMISFNQSEENLRQCLSHPLSLIISDGFYVKGRPHPRLWGTFPRLLGTFVREQKLLSLGEAIRKITRAPTERFGAFGLGRIEAGAIADITVFDPNEIGSPADYERPEQLPMGIHAVFRRGAQVV